MDSPPPPPKSRVPAGFREKILRAHQLPRYSGPYSVGIIDLEIPVREPRIFSNITRHGQALLRLQTVLMSIYYPSAFGSGAGASPDGRKKWSRATWMPRPRRETAQGYAKFAGFSPPWLLTAWFSLTTMFNKIPAFRNAQLADHWPAPKNSRQAGYDVTNECGRPPDGESESPTFPLLILSHGLGGTRTTCSTVCGEFASYGFIVVAIEHRDGSGPRTCVHVPDDEHHPAVATFSEEERRRGYRTIDYVFSKHNALDTSPASPDGVDRELRGAQIDLRLAEIEEAYHVLCLIGEGRGEEVAKQNLRKSGKHGASSRELQGIQWQRWKGRCHLNQVTMLGHSFGAAMAVEVLRHVKDRFRFIGQGILYDPWGAAIQRLDLNPKFQIDTPILCINSEAFMYWPANFQMLTSLCHEARDNKRPAWMLTVRGSIHLSATDFPLLYPHVASVGLKMTVHPVRAIDLNVNASLEFLARAMPARFPRALNRGDDEHLLDVAVLAALPTDRTPPEKWRALRVRVPRELALRLTPRLWRRYRLSRRERDVAPRDRRGRVLIGREVWGEEIFMHVAPTREEWEEHEVGGGRERPGDRRPGKDGGRERHASVGAGPELRLSGVRVHAIHPVFDGRART